MRSHIILHGMYFNQQHCWNLCQYFYFGINTINFEITKDTFTTRPGNSPVEYLNLDAFIFKVNTNSLICNCNRIHDIDNTLHYLDLLVLLRTDCQECQLPGKVKYNSRRPYARATPQISVFHNRRCSTH